MEMPQSTRTKTHESLNHVHTINYLTHLLSGKQVIVIYICVYMERDRGEGCVNISNILLIFIKNTWPLIKVMLKFSLKRQICNKLSLLD
ncbi:hypothetical protein Hdeb2414_s0022g00613421 [Helianthus debilis subsp. tardiflorus]